MPDKDEEPRTEKENMDAPQEEFIDDTPPSSTETPLPGKKSPGKRDEDAKPKR